MKQHIQSIAIAAALFTLAAARLRWRQRHRSAEQRRRARHPAAPQAQRHRQHLPVHLVQARGAPGQAQAADRGRQADHAVLRSGSPDFASVDISGYDISFDAKTIVFVGAARHRSDLRAVRPHARRRQRHADRSTDPLRDYVSPIFLPGDAILFMTNERCRATDVRAAPWTSTSAAPRPSSAGSTSTAPTWSSARATCRTARSPSLASDGRVIFTQWDHLGDENERPPDVRQPGHDRSCARAFGKEGTGASNSTLKAREISPGRFVAIATARDRTIQAGALDRHPPRLTSRTHDGVVSAPTNQSEANATLRLLTPDVPIDNTPSASTIGRYYDAFPLNAKDKPDLLVSWADGPVEPSVLGRRRAVGELRRLPLRHRAPAAPPDPRRPRHVGHLRSAARQPARRPTSSSSAQDPQARRPAC